MHVRSFKLVDGTELIAELVSTTGMGYQIKRPLRVVPMQGPEGVHIGFTLWSMIQARDTVIELLGSGLIASPVEVDQEVADSYTTQVSGIILPTAGSGQILTG